MIVELKRLFLGSMSLEDLHIKALRLVKEADYPEGDTRNRVLRDTIISGLASDKICAKVIKEGKMSHWPESWKLPDLRSQPSDILIGCKKPQRSIMCSTARDLRRRADPDPVVAAAAVAAILLMMENPPN